MKYIIVRSSVKKAFLVLTLCFLLLRSSICFTFQFSKAIQSEQKMTTLNAATLTQFGPSAASLFNNMKTPASILAGSMVPLGILNVLPKHPDKPDTKWMKIVRETYLLVSVFSFGSELLAVMYATMAVNKLTETPIAPAASLFELLKRDFALAWTGTNSHFVFGMFGLIYMISVRSFFMVRSSNANKYFATAIFSALGSLCSLMLAAVNRQVAAGPGMGRNVCYLFYDYLRLLFKQAYTQCGILEIAALLLGMKAISSIIMGLLTTTGETKEKDE